MANVEERLVFHYVDMLPNGGCIQNERIKLVPFSPDRHSQEFIRLSNVEQDKDLYSHLPFGPFQSVDDLNAYFRCAVESDPTRILFAIIDKTRESRNADIDSDGCLAGIVGLLDAQPENLSCEVGYLIILHPYRGGHSLANAVGLLLFWCLDLRDAGGIGLRRVAWKCSQLNKVSSENAISLGFEFEGVLRWDLLLNPGPRKGGNYTQLRPGDPKRECPGRDTAVYSVVWEDWDSGTRRSVARIMAE